MKINLRKIKQTDLEKYKYWKQPIHKYHSLNGPYFKKKSSVEIEEEVKKLSKQFEQGNENPLPQKMIISNTKGNLIGEVNWYWKSKETNWLEIGIVIFDEKNWGKGIGEAALKLWIKEVFVTKKEIVRLGLTTWSGNQGMIKLSEKLGLKKEAEYRKARIIEGKYYDSISYGILREEWKTEIITNEIH